MPVLKILSKIGVDLSFVFVFQYGLKGSAMAAVSQFTAGDTELHVLGPVKQICSLCCLGLGNQVGSLEFV